MPESGEVIVIVLNIFVAISGFLTVFILSAMWRGQTKQGEDITKCLSKLAVHEERIHFQEKTLERYEREAEKQCANCPMRTAQI